MFTVAPSTDVGLALMRDVPFFSLNLMLYEQLRQSVRHRRAQQFGHQSDTFQELSPSEAIFTGAIAQVGQHYFFLLSA